MRVIDKTPASAEKSGAISGILGNLQHTLGMGGESDRQAEEKLIAHLNMLSSPYTLLRNVRLAGLTEPVPLVLVGPAGISVILATSIKGVFRIKEDSLAEMKPGSQQFNLARPNLVAQTLQYASAVQNHILQKGYEVPPVQGVLFYANPGTHVDSLRPAVRVVLADGLDRFISGLVQSAVAFSNEDVNTLVLLFDEPEPEADQTVAPFMDDEALEVIEAAPAEPPPKKEPEIIKNLETRISRLRITRQQWILLGIFSIVDVVCLVTFVIAYIVIY